MATTQDVPFYLDFVSPYTWIALMRADAVAREQRIRWEMRPIVYSALLDAHGLVGPVERPAKRTYTFHDVARTAQHLGLRFEGPPVRTQFLFRDAPQAHRLATNLADTCWGQGRPLTDMGVIEEAVDEAGLEAMDLARRIAESEIKDGLREQTERALRLGIFGVPTFEFDGELFWGHDRMDQLVRRMQGIAPPAAKLAGPFLTRPPGPQRTRAPTGESGDKS